MSAKITMTVSDVVEMRDHMTLALRLLDEEKIDRVRAILEAYRDDANETLGRV